MSNIPVPPAPLDRLAELLRQAEAKTRVQELTQLIRKAAEPLKPIGERLANAERRAREIRPGRLRELEQIEVEDVRLKELIRKAALNRTLLGAEEQRVAEQLIEESRVDIEIRRRQTQLEVSTINREQDEARREARMYLERFRTLRREMERLLPGTDEQFHAEDDVAHDVESYFSEYQIRSFAKEVDDSSAHYGTLTQREQYAQMMIWIGRLRRFQTSEPTEEERDLLELIFRKLVTLSKTYEPGYIEAFHRQYQADWDIYINEAQDRLRAAGEEARHGRSGDSRRRSADVGPHARKSAQATLDELRTVIASHDLPRDGGDTFRETLIRAIETYGPLDGELIDLVMPYRDLCIGNELSGLRKYLDQLAEDSYRPRPIAAVVASESSGVRELVAATHGRKALVLGGAVREDSRRTLLRAFEFTELDWLPYDDTRPSQLDQVEARLRSGETEMVFLLMNAVGRQVASRILPLCQTLQVPCIQVERGLTIGQVTDGLRRALANGQQANAATTAAAVIDDDETEDDDDEDLDADFNDDDDLDDEDDD